MTCKIDAAAAVAAFIPPRRLNCKTGVNMSIFLLFNILKALVEKSEICRVMDPSHSADA